MKQIGIVFTISMLLALAALPAQAVLVLQAPSTVDNASVVPVKVEMAPALKKGDTLRFYNGDLPILDVSITGKAELSAFDIRFRLTHPRLSAVLCGSRSEAAETNVTLGKPATWTTIGPDTKQQVLSKNWRNGILLSGKFSPEKHIGEISFRHGSDAIVFATNHYLTDSPRLIIQSNLPEHAITADFKLNTAPELNHVLTKADRCTLGAAAPAEGASYEKLDEATRKQQAAKGELVDTESRTYPPGDIRQYFGTSLLVTPDGNWRACELDQRPTRVEMLESMRRSYRNRFGEIYAEQWTWVKIRVVEGSKSGCEGWTHDHVSVLRPIGGILGGASSNPVSDAPPSNTSVSRQEAKPTPTWPVIGLGRGGLGLFQKIVNIGEQDPRPQFQKPLNCGRWGGNAMGSEWYLALGAGGLRFNAAKALVTDGKDKGCEGWLATNFPPADGLIPNDPRYLFQATGTVYDFVFDGVQGVRKGVVCKLDADTPVSVVERRLHRVFDADGNILEGKGYDLFRIIKHAVNGKGGCEGWVNRDQIVYTSRR